MRSPVRSLAGALIAFGIGLMAACSVDETGLGGRVPGVGGSAGGSATGGVGASGGRGGAAGTGIAGTGVAGMGVAGMGVAGMGVAGTSGPGGGPGGAGPGDAGAAGTTAVGGGGGTSDVAGQGGGGMAGTGTGGTGTAGIGGTGGTTATCGPNTCPDCFRCGMQGSCEPTPSARWTITCQSAVIAAMKPNGMTWDAPPPATSGTAPDAFCELTVDDDDTGETSVVNDSLTPMWNQAVNPNSGPNVTASLLMSAQNRWRIAIIDRDVQPPGSTEPVCQIMPRLTADDLHRGTVSLMAGSCTQVNLGLACDEN
jgi:hypothetical protein